MFPLESIRACAAELSRKADLKQYTNIQAMDDLDEIRDWLGYERVNLWGGSYGTRSAMVYLKRHPESVRSVILDSVVPIDFHSPVTYARSAQTALDRVIDDCGADESCRAAFPHLRTEFAAVLERLSRAPGRGTIQHPETRKSFELSIPRTSFMTTLRSMQYSPAGYVRIPMVIHEAYGGNFAPILWEAAGNGGPASWMGLFLSVTCAEDLPRIDPAEIAAQIAGTYMGDDRIGQQQAACAAWPTARLPADFWTPAESAVPVLALSGWMDPVTPPEAAKEVLRHLPNSAHVIVRDSAHGTYGLSNLPCYFGIISKFVQDGSPIGLDASCTQSMKRGPFALKDDPSQRR
jgi:pimeloyl-ACP methyl ester carboxylesterase